MCPQGEGGVQGEHRPASRRLQGYSPRVFAGVLVALSQLVPLQYMAVVPGILWLVTVGIGFARTDRRPG